MYQLPFEQALQAISSGVIIVDPHQPDMPIVYVNDAFQRMTGYAASEVIGRNCRFLQGDDRGQPQLDIIREAIAAAEPCQVILRNYRKDGTLFWNDLRITPIFDANGKLIYFVGIQHDISRERADEDALHQAYEELKERVKIRADELEKAYHLLEQSEHRLAAILEMAMDGIISVNDRYEIVLYNRGAEDLFGYRADEVLGKSLNILLPIITAKSHNQHITAFAQTPEQSRLMHERGQVYGRRKDGSVFPAEVSISKILEDGNYIFTAIVHDMSEHQAVAESLRQERDLLNKMMDTSPVGITIVDKTGQIIFANKRAEEISGVTRDTMKHRTYDAPVWRHTDFDGNPWPDEKQPFSQVMATKQAVFDVRHAIEWDNGRKVYLSINGAPILDEQGEIAQVVFAMQDVTLQKKWEDEMRQSLAREHQLNEVKSRFLSLVSHEFRTPMTIMMTYSGLIRMQAETITPEDLITRLAKIEEQIQRLSTLIGEVTLIHKSQMTTPVISPTRISLMLFFAQIIGEVQTAYGSDVTIEFTANKSIGEVYLDEILLHQILSNLMSNAVKYTQARGAGYHVFFSYWAEQENLVIQIRDEGIGIPLDDQQHLFEVFYRSKNTADISGTGLGLVIAKNAVDALHGQISFVSEPNVGTTFTIKLPREWRKN